MVNPPCRIRRSSPSRLQPLLRTPDRPSLGAPPRQSIFQNHLSITRLGRRAYEPLERGSSEQIAALLSPLPPANRAALVDSIRTIQRALAPPAEPRFTLRSHRYREITLWTQAQFVAARHIYERAGFRLARVEKHHHFGPEMDGEMWNLTL